MKERWNGFALLFVSILAVIAIYPVEIVAQEACRISVDAEEPGDECLDCFEPPPPPPPASTSNCLPCYRNLPPLVGHGTTVDGRKKLNIAIDSSWAVTNEGYPSPGLINTKILDAVNGAIQGWNDARDADGKTTVSWFGLDSVSVADIVIRRAPSDQIQNGLAEINTTVVPNVITLADGFQTANLADITAILSHELGHRLGLHHPADIGCSGGTIMDGYVKGTYRAIHYAIEPNDVAQANVSAKTTEKCTFAIEQVVGCGPDEGGGDGGGALACAGPRPFETCICGADGNWDCNNSRCVGAPPFASCSCDYFTGQWNCGGGGCYGTRPECGIGTAVCSSAGEWECPFGCPSPEPFCPGTQRCNEYGHWECTSIVIGGGDEPNCGDEDEWWWHPDPECPLR